jgi:hypothetical protein
VLPSEDCSFRLVLFGADHGKQLSVDRSAVMRLKLVTVMKEEEELKEYDDVLATYSCTADV